MEGMTIREQMGMETLVGLARQAQAFSANITINSIQLGRVFSEAKVLVPHGEWQKWVSENSGLSVRSAQHLMEAYNRFGDNADICRLDKSKVFELLTLPAGEEEQFLAEHDVENMSVREVKAAVKSEREKELEAENQRLEELLHMEKTCRTNAEMRAEKALSGQTVSEEVKRQMDAVEESLKETVEQNSELRKERDDALSDADFYKKEYDRVSEELLAAASTKAKGDAERTISEDLSGDEFARHARSFLGNVNITTVMRERFAEMDLEEFGVFNNNMKLIENWVDQTRRAMNTVPGEAIVYE